MSSISLFFASALILSSASSVFGYYYAFTTNFCSGKLVDNIFKSAVKDCPIPDIFYGPGFPTRPTPLDKVTNPATIEDISLAWFLDEEGNPALNVTFTALSPDSTQKYELNLLADGYPTPIFCGQIHTARPENGQEMERQTLSVEVRCDADRLKANMDVDVAVQATGGDDSILPKSQAYNLPSCDDPTMYNSNQCEGERKKRIKFNLQQEGNSTVVVLTTSSAYAKQSKGAKVIVAIRCRHQGGLDGWEFIGDPINMYWPQRTTRFDDLTPGQTYQVLVWRSGEYRRYSEVITMKPDQKQMRYSEGLVNRLLKRSVGEA